LPGVPPRENLLHWMGFKTRGFCPYRGPRGGFFQKLFFFPPLAPEGFFPPCWGGGFGGAQGPFLPPPLFPGPPPPFFCLWEHFFGRFPFFGFPPPQTPKKGKSFPSGKKKRILFLPPPPPRAPKKTYRARLEKNYNGWREKNGGPGWGGGGATKTFGKTFLALFPPGPVLGAPGRPPSPERKTRAPRKKKIFGAKPLIKPPPPPPPKKWGGPPGPPPFPGFFAFFFGPLKSRSLKTEPPPPRWPPPFSFF